MAPTMYPPALKKAAAFCLLFLISGVSGFAAEELLGIDNPLHGYWTKTPRDRFSRLKSQLESGQIQLDTSGELPFLTSVLKELEVPVNSQMLVYSVTSLQKNLISPRRPRALYFNDDTYVGYVPGGRIEIVSLDPDLGGIFYIFDRLKPGRLSHVERTDECMTCHSTKHMQEIPGLVIESVVPGITGGGEKAFRRERSGHDIPFEERFGGYHLTGAPGFPQHWANLLLEYTPQGRRERPIQPGELFDITRYPVPTSDILPHLLHEHQVGFVNRALQASYRTRALLHDKGGEAETVAKELRTMAQTLVRYLLFADEVALPQGGIEGDTGFKAAFAAMSRRTSAGASLRDLDLRTRMLRYRCSYMIYSPAFTGLPAELKKHVFQVLDEALAESNSEADFSYLGQEEKRVIRAIIRETVQDLPKDWGGARA